MYARLVAMIRKEFIQVVRDPRALAMIIVTPVAWLVAFGYAVNFDVKHVATGVVDQAHNAASEALIADLHASVSFSLTNVRATDAGGLRDAIRRGQIGAGLLVPPGYGTLAGHAPVRVFLDGSDLFGSKSVQAAAQTVLQRAALRQIQQGAAAFGAMLPVTATAPVFDSLYNPEMHSSYVMIPGLIGTVMGYISMVMTALGVARERERGTLEQLMVTPIRPLELMLGKVLPYVLIGAADFILVVVIGTMLFSVPLRGSLVVLAVAALCFLLTALSLGLLISTVSQNQQQAMQLAVFTLLPQLIFSGFIFPLAAMPWSVRWISYVVPLAYLIPVMRGVFLKAAGWGDVWPDIVALAIYSAVLVVLATVRFRKRIA